MKKDKPGCSKRSGVFLLAFALLLSFLPLFPSLKVQAAQQTVSGTFDYTASAQLYEGLNAQRAAYGLPALGWDSSVEWFATQRAAELYVLNSHLRPDGSSFSYGENYIVGAASPADATASFMASPAHSANILSAAYTGVACAVFYCDGRSFWVQIFTFNGGGAPENSGSLSESRTVTTADTEQPQVGAVDDRLQIEVGSYIMAGGKANGQTVSASWSSDDPSVVMVSDNGKIVGIQPGYAVVTADFGNGQVKRILVTVTASGAAAPLPAPLPESVPEALPQESAESVDEGQPELSFGPVLPEERSPLPEDEAAAAEARFDPFRPARPAEETPILQERGFSALRLSALTFRLQRIGSYLSRSGAEQKLQDGLTWIWEEYYAVHAEERLGQWQLLLRDQLRIFLP